MSVNTEYLQTHKDRKTTMNAFIINGNNKPTMLEGRIVMADEFSFVLNECLIQIDKLISITPKSNKYI